MIELNKIYCEDCLDLLNRVDSNSVDLVFSDPPYNKNKNYEVYQDNLPEDEYWDWVKRFIAEYKRISNNQLAIFIGADLIKKYWDLIPEAKLIIVRKGAIGTPFKDYFRQYFGLLVTAEPNRQIYDLWWNIKMPGEGYFFKEERYPNPGLTSLKLTQRVINYFTKENDIVFDGFMGVGTTAVACATLDRQWLGSEINPNYIALANKRIAKELNQLKLAI